MEQRGNIFGPRIRPIDWFRYCVGSKWNYISKYYAVWFNTHVCFVETTNVLLDHTIFYYNTKTKCHCYGGVRRINGCFDPVLDWISYLFCRRLRAWRSWRRKVSSTGAATVAGMNASICTMMRSSTKPSRSVSHATPSLTQVVVSGRKWSYSNESSEMKLRQETSKTGCCAHTRPCVLVKRPKQALWDSDFVATLRMRVYTRMKTLPVFLVTTNCLMYYELL